MMCPSCTTERLMLAERSGIEIDYCPACRGVWLDRGELDKLIERSAATLPAPAAAPAPMAATTPPPPPRRKDYDDDDDDDWKKYGKHKKKKSLLGEIFDF